MDTQPLCQYSRPVNGGLARAAEGFAVVRPEILPVACLRARDRNRAVLPTRPLDAGSRLVAVGSHLPSFADAWSGDIEQNRGSETFCAGNRQGLAGTNTALDVLAGAQAAEGTEVIACSA